MKQQKLYYLCAIVWLAASLCICSISNDCYAKQGQGRTILIKQTSPSLNGNAPRSITENPFSAELLDMGVLLFADTDWGDVGVTLSSIEGDYYYTVFDTSDGAIVLLTNGNIGDSYTITIVTSGGLIFEGEFYL